jgi:hypothetical protein
MLYQNASTGNAVELSPAEAARFERKPGEGPQSDCKQSAHRPRRGQATCFAKIEP